MSGKKREILIINTSGLGLGGITTHMLNYITEMKREKCDYVYTIIVTGTSDNRVLEKFADLGCELKKMPDRKKHFLGYITALEKIMHNKQFDVVHVHGNSSTMVLELVTAKINKVSVRIAHCHNSKCEHPMIHRLLKPVFKQCYTQAVACSLLAGDWIFGRENYTILPNALDISKFQFDSELRNQYRESLGIDSDTLLLGHVGNFNEQKNHEFLINIFYELQKERKSKLVLIGTGKLLERVKKQVDELRIHDKVHFMGIRDDVNCWMQAMDVFVFPSRWEGFGMVLIEGQISNLPMVVSTEVPQIVNVSNNIRYVDLNKGSKLWKDVILNLCSDSNRSCSVDARIYQYDIKENGGKLEKLYNS